MNVTLLLGKSLRLKQFIKLKPEVYLVAAQVNSCLFQHLLTFSSASTLYTPIYTITGTLLLI